MATITVNGKIQDTELPVTLLELIGRNEVKQPEMVSVQVNQRFVNRNEFSTFQVNDGDEVEFLYFMGGGCRL